MSYSLNNYNNWILGSFLGDSYINKKYQLEVAHSTEQGDCSTHKFYLLQNSNLLANNAQPTIYNRLDKRTNRIYTKFSIKTKSYFYDYRHLFYPQPNMIKIVPSNIDQLITEQGLAYWYMDDGGRNSGNKLSKGMVFDVSNFTFDDQLKLKNLLEKKFLCGVAKRQYINEIHNIKIQNYIYVLQVQNIFVI